MEAVVIFKAVSISKSIASYLGFIDSVSSDVKKLLHQSFESGKKNLEYAQTASEANQKLYIQKALGNFISAQSVENDENRISSYLGAALCQYLLGDIANARKSLEQISTVILSKSEITKAAALDLAFGKKDGIIASDEMIGPWGIMQRGIKRAFGKRGNRENSRILSFEEYKRKALSVRI